MSIDQKHERDFTPESIKQKENRAQHMDDNGAEPISPSEQASLDQMEAGYGESANDPRESSDNSQRGDSGIEEESDSGNLDNVSGQSEIPYREEKTAGRFFLRGRIKKKTAAIAAAVTVVGAGGALIISIISGPMQLIQFGKLISLAHFSNNAEFNNDRSARRMYHLLKGKPQTSRLGIVNNNIADKLEIKLNNKSGLKSVYHADTGRFIGFEVLDENRAANQISDLRNDGIDVTDRNGKRFIDLHDLNFRERRSAIRTFVRGADIDGIAGKLSSRLLIKRAGVDFHPLKNIKRKTGDRLIDYYNDRKKERNERIRDGTNPDIVNAPEGDKSEDTNNNDKIDPEEAANPEGDEAAKAGREIIGDADIDVDSPSAVKSLKTKLLAKVGGGAAAVVGVVCTLRELGEGAEKLQYTQTILPMIRTGMMYASIASQIQTGQGVNLDELGSLNAGLFDESDDNDPTTHPSSVFSAQPFQAMRGEALTGNEIPDHLRPSKIDEKPYFFQLIDDIPGVDGACGVADFIAGIPIIKEIGALTSEIVGAIIPIDKLVDGIVGWIAGKGMDYGAEGGSLGAIAMYGGRLAANNQNAASGGVELSGTESTELALYNQESVNYDFSQRSMFAKVFDLYDVRSVGARLAMSAPQTPSSAFTSFITAPFRAFGLATPKATAATSYNYGFNEVGFSVTEMNDLSIADPYAVADEVEDQLDELNEKYGKPCFNITVELTADSIKVVNGDTSYNPNTDENKEAIKNCNSSTDPMLLKYRAYVADAVGTQSEACYLDVDEAACGELGFGVQETSGAASSTPSSLTTPGLNGYSIPCAGQARTVVRRAEGTNGPSADWSGIPDSGTIGATVEGKPIKVYIREACSTTNIKTIVLVSSIHGSENGGQFVSHELLFNTPIPGNVRIVAIPELNGDSIIPRLRKNSNGVDLNRNNDYLWGSLTDFDEIRPYGKNYKGTAPASEPETQAINSFLSALGRASLSLHYHDDLNWLAPVGNTPVSIASSYAAVTDMSVGNDGGTTVTQRGSLDAWYNKQTGTPTLLIEMSSNLSQPIISKHVEAVKALLSGTQL